jgi:hypothetical protein
VRQEDLQILLQRIPCPLLRLHLTNGRTFDIRDPEQVLVSPSTVELLIPGEKSREAVISLLHVIWAEVVSPP